MEMIFHMTIYIFSNFILCTKSNNQNKDRGYFEKIKSLIKLDIRQE
mgnify:CR=1 FL=1